jgi:hypothetical protein
MAYDPEADLRIAASDGADLSIVWTETGATISIGGDQPMDQPPCRITLDRKQILDLGRYIYDGAMVRWDSWTPFTWPNRG